MPSVELHRQSDVVLALCGVSVGRVYPVEPWTFPGCGFPLKLRRRGGGKVAPAGSRGFPWLPVEPPQLRVPVPPPIANFAFSFVPRVFAEGQSSVSWFVQTEHPRAPQAGVPRYLRREGDSASVRSASQEVRVEPATSPKLILFASSVSAVFAVGCCWLSSAIRIDLSPRDS